MSPRLLYAIKPCGWGCIIPGKATWTTPSIHPASPSIHITHSSAPLTIHLPCFQEKVNRRSSSFFSMEDPSTLPSAHPFLPLIAFIRPFFMKEEREHLLSSWIIHNQFHREPDRQKTSEWRAWGINAEKHAFSLSHACFLASARELSWSSAHFGCPTSVFTWRFFCKSSLWPRAFNRLIWTLCRFLLSFQSLYLQAYSKVPACLC